MNLGHRPPKEWTEKWAAENPKKALVLLLFGFGMMVYVTWLVLHDP